MNEMVLSLFQKLVMCFCVLSLFLPFYCGAFPFIFEFFVFWNSTSFPLCVCVRVCLCTYSHTYICIHTRTCVCVCMRFCAQLCLTVCDPMYCSPPGSSVHGISQARILEWVAMPFSRESSRPRV